MVVCDVGYFTSVEKNGYNTSGKKHKNNQFTVTTINYGKVFFKRVVTNKLDLQRWQLKGERYSYVMIQVQKSHPLSRNLPVCLSLTVGMEGGYCLQCIIQCTKYYNWLVLNGNRKAQLFISSLFTGLLKLCSSKMVTRMHYLLANTSNPISSHPQVPYSATMGVNLIPINISFIHYAMIILTTQHVWHQW